MKDDVNGSESAVLLMTFVFFCLYVLTFLQREIPRVFTECGMDGGMAQALIWGSKSTKGNN